MDWDKVFAGFLYLCCFALCALVLLLIGGFGCALFGGIDKTYSDGQRIGTITKFSNKGFICKTWEGEMNLGGFRKGDKGQAVANTWEFSDPSGSFAAEINRMAESGEPCVIHYRQVLVRSIWSADSDYYVTAIVPCKE